MKKALQLKCANCIRTNKYQFVFIAAFVCLFSNCSTDIKLFGPFTELPIVYALLDPTAETHYIRIERTFATEGTSAFDLAQNPSIIYFPDERIEVSVEEYDGATLLQSWQLEQVNGDSLDLPRKEGIFASSPNLFYRFKASLTQDYSYRFKMTKGDTLITSVTELVKPFQVFFPVAPGSAIDFSDTTKFKFEIATSTNGYIYDGWFELFYLEEELSTGSTTLESIRYPMFSNILSEPGAGPTALEIRFTNLDFYSGLSRNLEAAAPGIKRYFEHLEIQINGGGAELYLLYLNSIANTGLVQDFSTAQYTNIDEGLGLFSSRREVRIEEVTLTPTSIDTLACGQKTSHLGFAPSTLSPYYPDCQ